MLTRTPFPRIRPRLTSIYPTWLHDPTFINLTEYLEVVGDSDGPAEGGHRAGVGPLVSAPEVLHPEAVPAPQAVPGVRADHHGPGRDHLLPMLPDHHQLAQVLHCARQRHLEQCCHEL